MDENELGSYEEFKKLLEEEIKEFKKKYEDIEKVERLVPFLK